MSRRLMVVFRFLDSKQETHEADLLTTEGVQWRLDQGEDILLVPMGNVRMVTVKKTVPGAGQ